MYKCTECGHIFEDSEREFWHESRGECFGFSASEKCGGECPVCGGEAAEAKECLECGFEHFDDEMFSGICEDCINGYRKDFKTCYKIAKEGEDNEAVFLNALLTTIFTTSDIEQILLDFLEKNNPDVDCIKYIERDKEWFAEGLEWEVRK